MRLNFRSEYGDDKFDTDLFETGSMHGATAVDQIDRIILRGGNNRSWARIWNPDKTAYTIDQYYRDLQIAMSGHGSRGAFVHLYINGLYWGLYNPTERTDEWFTSAYFDGDPDDWFAVNHGGDLSGNDNRYDYMRNTLANRNMSNPANYAEMQEYLDVENFIDYLLVSWWTGTGDWPGNNWYGGNRNATSPLGPAPFRFFAWDGEWSWDSPRGGSAQGQVHPDFRKNQSGGSTIPKLWHALRRNDDFMMLFADRAYKHFFHDGVLVDANAQARWLQLNELIRDAAVAESARWGDSLESLGGNYPLRTRDVDWQREVNAIFNRIDGNGAHMIGGGNHSLRDENYYPDVDPPEFNRHGGLVDLSFGLTMSASAGKIYYTLDGSDPRMPGGAVNFGSALEYDGLPVVLSDPVVVKGRLLAGGTWSALNEAFFLVGEAASISNLVVSEINYDPHDPTVAELAVRADLVADDFEFIEVRNVGPFAVKLDGVAFVGGIEYTFPAGTVIALRPGESLVLARNVDAYAVRYPNAPVPSGQYKRRLNDDGEQIELHDFQGNRIARFAYNDAGSWPGRAAGKGASLELIAPESVPAAEPARSEYLNDAENWRSSSEYGGSPGVQGSGPTSDVVVNEILAHTHLPAVDAIELHNTTGNPIDVGGWYLSDSWGWASNPNNGNYKKFAIPGGTIIPAGGYRVFDENDFNATGMDGNPLNDDPHDFALDADHGDDVWLMEPDSNGKLVRFVDHVEFDAMAEGRSWGLWPDATGVLYPMISPTVDRQHPENGLNSGPRLGSVLISELHYDPSPEADDNDLEFIEIYNSLPLTVDLTNWRIRKGIDYDFPADTMLGPGSTLIVVPFSTDDTVRLEAFSEEYWRDPGQGGQPIPQDIVILGGYQGQLRNDGERVQLQRPGEAPPDEPEFLPGLLVDEVRYDDEIPWPTGAGGGGNSLQRIAVGTWGNDATNWNASAPTPGTTLFEPPQPAQIVGRHVFYNGSDFDGDDLGPNVRDDGAVALDKTALLPGQTATFANYTSYSRGINGLMIDVAGLPPGAVISVDDFEFHVGNSNDPTAWLPGSDPTSITVRPGQGTDSSDRTTLVWPDNTIQKQWLQVTVLATANTGLPEPDVFYSGNAIGESGNSTTDAKVNAFDMLAARNNQRNFLDPAPIDFDYDYNRDERVNAVDMLIARNNQTHFLNALKLITVPGAKTSIRDAALAEVGSRETSPGKPTWLYEFDMERESTEKVGSAEESTDTVLMITDA